MENYFKIINKEETICISINWSSSINKDDKEKLFKIILEATDLWEPEQNPQENCFKY